MSPKPTSVHQIQWNRYLQKPLDVSNTSCFLYIRRLRFTHHDDCIFQTFHDALSAPYRFAPIERIIWGETSPLQLPTNV